MRRWITVLLAVVALSIAGCDVGGDDGEDGDKPPIGAAKNFRVKQGLVPKSDSAASGGEVENYVPKGELVADSGFRPETDGFAFENYGNEMKPQNLGPAEVESLFGDQVCLSGTGEECELIPAAEKWMNNQNEGMAGGHCEGFSIAALRMFNEKLDVQDFGAGADVTSDLGIVKNVGLQASIAEHFVYQALPPILEGRVNGTPTEVFEELRDALNSGDELYTLGIYKPDASGGHAITPFAIEDKGGGKYAILVYDNNFPGATRAVQLDTKSDSWRYVSGTNPKDLGQVYKGDADTETLELDPMTPGEEQSPCPFCAGGEGDDDESKGAVLPKSKQYTEITLGGDPRNHPHLVFTDDQNRKTGVVDGRMLREIPDVEVVKTYATQNWEGAPEPRYRLPEGSEYTITVDGSDLKKTAKTKVNLVGNGLVIEIEEIKIAPGQKDEMALPGGYGITYQTNGKEGIAPEFFAGLVEDDAAYNFSTTAVGVKPGSTLSLLVEQKEKVMILDSTGSEGGDAGDAIFIMTLAKAGADGKVATWQNANLTLDGRKEEKAAFEYGESPMTGKPLPLVLLDRKDEPIKVINAKPVK